MFRTKISLSKKVRLLGQLLKLQFYMYTINLINRKPFDQINSLSLHFIRALLLHGIKRKGFR